MAWQRTATKGVYYDRDKKRYKITWRQRRADGKVYQTSETVGSLDKAKKIKKLADLHGDRPDMEGVIRGTDFVGHRGRSYSQTPRKIQTTAPTYNSIEHYMPRFLANHGYRQAAGVNCSRYSDWTTAMASNRIYGTCAFCHGDPCAERPQGALYSPIHHEYQLWKTAKWMNDLMRSEGFSCPLCDGRPSVRADLACEPGHLVREQRQLVDHLVDPTGQLPCPRWVVVRFGFLVLRNDIRLTR